jgi:nitrogen fixation/metabolism regulation signal transduction histidine kinase
MTLAAHHLLFIRAMESGQGYWSKMFGSASVIFALVALGLVWVGLRLSNRISGPLYRVTQVLAEVTQGKLPRMCKIRTGDKHPEVADALTDALTTLRKARSEESAAWREQGERLATLAKEVSGAPAETLSQLAAKAQERSKKLALD